MTTPLPSLTHSPSTSLQLSNNETAVTLPPLIHSWLASLFQPRPIPPFEKDSMSIHTLTQLHSLTVQRQRLTRLLEEDAQAKLIEYQQDNHYKASILAALSMLPSSLASALPASEPFSRPHCTFTPPASLYSSLSALTSLAQRLSIHSVDEPVMVAALVAHKAAERSERYEEQQLTHAVHQLQQQIHTTQHDITAHKALLDQLDQSSRTLQCETQSYTSELHTYTTKHKEYNHRLAAAQHKLKQHNSPTLTQLLAVHDEVGVLESRLQRLQSEVGVWDGLSSEVRVARRQVAEAEMEVVRLEGEIERRLCAMSAFE